MIIVSHGLGQITDLCDEAVLLEEGLVRAVGSSRSVVRTYLESVNEREAGRVQDEASPAVEIDVPEQPVESGTSVQTEPERPRRRGSGEIRITAVEMLDARDRPTGILVSGEPGALRVHFTARAYVSAAIFSFAVENPEGIWALGVNSKLFGPWEIHPGDGHYDFVMDRVLLAGGAYRVLTFVWIDTHVVDANDDGYPITVRHPDLEIAGVYLQPGSWALRAQGQGQRPEKLAESGSQKQVLGQVGLRVDQGSDEGLR